jgi:hypothetical protein
MSNGRIVIGGAFVLLGLTACTQQDSQTTTTRSEREKDSLIARSPIPGAKAVQKSMNVADSASARVNRQNAADTSQ